MVDPLSIGLTGIGLIGGLFAGEEEMTDEQRQAYNMLLQRSKGLDPKLLELMRARMKAAVGSEASALSASTASRLRRQRAPVAIQEQHLDKLRTRRMGAQTDALLGVEQLNEQIKGDALRQLSGFAGQFSPRQGYGQGFATLFGAGLQNLLRGDFGSDLEFLSEVDKHKRRASELSRYNVPTYRPRL